MPRSYMETIVRSSRDKRPPYILFIARSLERFRAQGLGLKGGRGGVGVGGVGFRNVTLRQEYAPQVDSYIGGCPMQKGMQGGLLGPLEH